MLQSTLQRPTGQFPLHSQHQKPRGQSLLQVLAWTSSSLHRLALRDVVAPLSGSSGNKLLTLLQGIEDVVAPLPGSSGDEHFTPPPGFGELVAKLR